MCQEVCPVNAEADDPGALRVPLLPLIEWLLPLGAARFLRGRCGATALTRAGRHRLLRNAIAALGNVAERPAGADALLRRATRDRRLEVREQARAALGEVLQGTAASLSPRCPTLPPSQACTTRSPDSVPRPCPDRVRLPEDADAPPARVADVTDLACPPYDVISDDAAP